MINKEALAQMLPGTILINTGRGALIDELAVANALEEGHLKAYCADVMEQEPPRKDNPLIKQPMLILHHILHGLLLKHVSD